MNKIGIVVIGAIGLVLIVAGSVVLGVFPGIMRQKIREQLSLDDNTTDAYDQWSQMKVPVTMSFNFFDLANEGDFKNLSDIELEQKGPYVYEETRTKHNVEYKDNGSLLAYNDYKIYEFNAQLSKGLAEEDAITFINFPTLGVLYNKVVDKYYHALYDSAQGLFDTLRPHLPANETTLFITRPMVDLIFKGLPFELFKNPLVNMFTHSDKFSIMKGKEMEEERWVIKTGKDDIDDLGQLVQFDNKDELLDSSGHYIWKNDSCECNKLKGTDGLFFKPNIQKDDVLFAFEPQLCRTVFFHFWKETEVRDITTYRFVVPKEYFENPKDNKNNECYYYDEGSRFTRGLLNIAFCDRRSLGAPIYMSEPFFIHADEKLRRQFKHELKPDLELNDENYGTFIDIEPNTGIVLKAVRRMQMNVGVKGDNKLFESQTNDTDEYIMPVFWIEEVGEATEDQADKLKSKVLNIKKIVNGVSIGVIVVGALMIVISIYFCIKR